MFTQVGDGYHGWPEAAPFDKIIVTCSPEKVPQPLVDQLSEGGLMIIPVGERYQQNLYLFRKRDDKLESEALKATLFVPMTGEAEAQREVQPDPLNPQIANGSFEEVARIERARKNAEPAGWHYQRQLAAHERLGHGTRRQSLSSPSTTRNPVAAPRPARLRGRRPQSLARSQLDFSVRGQNIRPGSKPERMADDRRSPSTTIAAQ